MPTVESASASVIETLNTAHLARYKSRLLPSVF
jgi:hypothetical protein